jgi:putative membrane-bound dehydrogenase-like protein
MKHLQTLFVLTVSLSGPNVPLLAADSVPIPKVPTPKILDSRLKLELFAAEPQIVTPTGIAVDEKGRVLCIESHTHFRPKDYQGPATDRIRMFEDANGDGKADKITTFYEGTTSTMNLAVYHDGSVYVATRREVFRLRDKDGDGKADERTPIVRLETKGDYPHNGLSGFAFDFPGNVYFGFGENLGEPYKLIGSDGVTLTGGDAGNIYRCGPNGEKLHRVATGFWNPFHLATDSFGRLFAVDNDPDARPPCRLLHVVEGGDYGFRFRLGRDGLHPFQSWNGEIPGTLPMVNGTGEAPSGIIAYESDGLPDDYFGDLLLTSWGDHRIERHRLTPRGASYDSKVEIIAKGNEDFRPVGIALAPDGSLYLSDWVKKDYNLHNHGRIWRLSRLGGKPVPRALDVDSAITSRHRPAREQAVRKTAALRDGRKMIEKVARMSELLQVRATSLAALASLVAATPVRERAEAIYTIVDWEKGSPELLAFATRLIFSPSWNLNDWKPPRPKWGERFRRIAVARAELFRLAARIDNDGKGAFDPDIDPFLAHRCGGDPFLDQAVRVAVRTTWAAQPREWRSADLKTIHWMEMLGEAHWLLALREAEPREVKFLTLTSLGNFDVPSRLVAIKWIGEERLGDCRKDLFDAAFNPPFFEPITQQLFDAYLAALEMLDGHPARNRWDQRVEKYVVDLVTKRDSPVEMRRFALRRLRTNHPAFTTAVFDDLMATMDPMLQREAVRTLGESRHRERTERLMSIVQDKARPVAVRADAVVGLDAEDKKTRDLLIVTALGDDSALRDEALRSLRGTTLDDKDQDRLASLADGASNVRELVERILKPQEKQKRPVANDLTAWQKLLEAKGDPEAGERIFFHPKSAGCLKCHQISARGGTIGPDLTLAASQLSRERLIESIVNPSREIAPQYVTWNVLKKDGTSFTGVFLGEDGARNQRYGDPEGKIIALKAEEIDDRQPTGKSLMPDELPHQLTLQEFRDLLAFLTTSK